MPGAAQYANSSTLRQNTVEGRPMIHPMLFHAARPSARPRAAAVPTLEPLEGRRLLSGYNVIDLGTLGGATSEAYGLNSGNQVVGAARTAGGTYHGFRFTDANRNGRADAGEMT